VAKSRHVLRWDEVWRGPGDRGCVPARLIASACMEPIGAIALNPEEIPPNSPSVNRQRPTGLVFSPLRWAIARARGGPRARWPMVGLGVRRRVARRHRGGGRRPAGRTPQDGPVLGPDRWAACLIPRSRVVRRAIGRLAVSTDGPFSARLGISLVTGSRGVTDPKVERGQQPL
jgi:hypothetical protein